MINAAIVGLGWWGKTLVEALADGSAVMRFVAMTTRTVSPDVETFAKQHKLRLLDSYEAVLRDRSIDAVVLATPPSGHVKQIIAAAAAGKHIFCEKPFSYSKRDAETAVDAFIKAKRALGRLQPPLPSRNGETARADSRRRPRHHPAHRMQHGASQRAVLQAGGVARREK